VGVDASADQLRLAKQRVQRVATLVQGDATRLPFPASSFALVVSAFTHTDMEHFAALAAEASRVLKPDGRFVYVGLHPCFKGPLPNRRDRTGLGSSTPTIGRRVGAPAAQGPAALA
jgi:ubiquinone/menaquinone biosynthesis C-methylase UbiE